MSGAIPQLRLYGFLSWTENFTLFAIYCPFVDTLRAMPLC